MADQIIADGSLSFLGGQDASKIPDLVPEDAYFAGVNVSIKNGVISPRPGWQKKILTFPDGTVELPNLQTRTYEEIFTSGKYQAAIPYSIGVEPYLILVISGIIYLINQSSFNVTIIEIEDEEKLNELHPRIFWESAGKFVVLHDYPARPIIIEGVSARRSNPDDFEVPISVMGIYNQNRLFIINAGNEFTAGDPTGSALLPNAPITFEEVLTPSAPYVGQIFQLPTNYNNEPITAAAFLQLADTSTGIGPLLLATKRAIHSFNTQNPRSTWEAGQFGSLLTYDTGIAGARSYVNVNSDLFFLSADGQVRTLSMSRDEQRRWAKVPISREVRNWLKYWDKDLVKYAVLGYFDNKIFISVNPFRTKALQTDLSKTTDYAHAGFVVLELESISTLGTTSKPAWAGLWTGVNPMDVVTVGDRFFVISKDPGFVNAVYELTPDSYVDEANGLRRQIKSTVYTREYDFKDPFQNKELHSIDVALAEVHEDLDLTLEYKPSQGAYFAKWKNFKHKAPTSVCTVPNDTQVNGLAPHSFRQLNFGAPVEQACDLISRTFFTWFRKVQLKFTIIGNYWELHDFKIKAVTKPQNETEPVCAGFPSVEIPLECNDDWNPGEYQKCQMI